MEIFGNIGAGELIFVLIIILLVVGPRRLPEITRTLGRTLYKIQMAYQEFVSAFEEELRAVEETAKEVSENVQTVKDEVNSTAALAKTATGAAAGERPTPQLIEALPVTHPTPTEQDKEDSPAND